MKLDLRGMRLEEIQAWVREKEEKSFRGQQIYDWIMKGASSLEEIQGLPQTLRLKLEQACCIAPTRIVQKHCSALDETRKYLLQLEDEHIIEAVFMKYKHGNSLCVSTQVGCKMGCRFCSSTLDGWVRNLTQGEMMGQVLEIQRDVGEKITHLVLMGSGEPLDNYDSVLAFMRLAHEEKALNLSYRRMTLSTCGIVPGIRALAQEGLPINLSVSLHHPRQEGRKALMPISAKYPLEEVVQAAKFYAEKTGRRVTYEYALIQGCNDAKEQAQDLAALVKGSLAHVNLIPVNPGGDGSHRRPSEKEVANFLKILQGHHIETTVRRELGQDIHGACGQLRHQKMKERGVALHGV